MLAFYFHPCNGKISGVPPQDKQGCCQWTVRPIVPAEYKWERMRMTPFSPFDFLPWATIKLKSSQSILTVHGA